MSNTITLSKAALDTALSTLSGRGLQLYIALIREDLGESAIALSLGKIAALWPSKNPEWCTKARQELVDLGFLVLISAPCTYRFCPLGAPSANEKAAAARTKKAARMVKKEGDPVKKEAPIKEENTPMNTMNTQINTPEAPEILSREEWEKKYWYDKRKAIGADYLVAHARIPADRRDDFVALCNNLRRTKNWGDAHFYFFFHLIDMGTIHIQDVELASHKLLQPATVRDIQDWVVSPPAKIAEQREEAWRDYQFRTIGIGEPGLPPEKNTPAPKEERAPANARTGTQMDVSNTPEKGENLRTGEALSEEEYLEAIGVTKRQEQQRAERPHVKTDAEKWQEWVQDALEIPAPETENGWGDEDF